MLPNQNIKPNKVLILALSGIGDALMFTPALQLLKKNLPDTEFDALVMYKGVEQIYNRLPQIDNVLFYDFLNSNFISALKFLFSVRKKYDITINVYPSNRKEYNIISFFIGAKIRAAVNYLRQSKRNFNFLNTNLIAEIDTLHNVEENVKLSEIVTQKKTDKIPELLFPLNEEDISVSTNFLTENEISEDQIVVGFHPGCSTLKNHIKRRWEPEKFAELASKLSAEFNAIIFLFGGKEEKELRRLIIEKSNAEKIIEVSAGNIAQSAAVMKRCDVFVSNDSGLMHIAASQKLKIVSIIGPTNTNYIHPWKTEYKTASLNLECSPCFYYSPKPLECHREDVKFKCIKELNVESVFEKVKGYLI